MTPDERKRGLVSAVEAKMKRLCEDKWKSLEFLGAGSTEVEFIIRGWKIELLWEIIDSLVDECEELRSAARGDDR